MKKLFFLPVFLLFTSIHAQGILGKIKDKAKQRADAKVDNAIDKGLDKAESTAKSDGNDSETDHKADKNENNASPTGKSQKQDIAAYGKYDFVPGDKIIFEDHVDKETIGEFPSKWNLHNGKIENATLNGEQVIAFLEGNYASISPLMEKPGDYLPDVFSLEFDMYVKAGGYNTMAIALHDDKDPSYKWNEEEVLEGWALTTGHTGSVKEASGDFPGDAEVFNNKWHHIAVSFNKGNIKIYTDQFRLCNLPRVNGKTNPSGIAFGCIGDPNNTIFMKNVRIAAGGGDLYKRVATEGKIITHGITFDVNKAVIKPESMGTLNEINKIMKDNPTVRFEIGGHTDSDGGDDANMKLSQARSEAVRDQLLKMGIDPSRLTAKGYGKTKPIDNNTSSEGKANNRRVEFVKL